MSRASLVRLRLLTWLTPRWNRRRPAVPAPRRSRLGADVLLLEDRSTPAALFGPSFGTGGTVFPPVVVPLDTGSPFGEARPRVNVDSERYAVWVG